MNVHNFFLFVLVIFVAVISAKEHVPVLVWSSKLDLLPVPGLRHLGAAEFSQLLHDGTKAKPTVVVFLEESLSVEDFSVKAEYEESPYEEVSQKVAKLDTLFFPSVSNPMKAIRLLCDSGYDWVRYEGKSPSGLKGPTVILVPLDEGSLTGDRKEVLRSHDKKIARIYDEIEKHHPHTLAVYSARRDAWVEAEKITNRVRRADKADEIDEEPYSGVVIVESGVAIIANSIVYYPDEANPKNLSTVSSISLTNDTENLLVVANFDTGDSLTFVFNSEAGSSWQWFLVSVNLQNNTLAPPDPIWAPYEWSYYCGNIAFKSASSNGYPRVQFTGLQVQPNIDGNFGDPIDCVPYFSMAIWSSIIITALLLFIMACGITMIMDINNNDRFDDPKGKTITINASD